MPGTNLTRDEAAARAALLRAGVQFVPAAQIDHAAFVQAEKPVWARFTATPGLRALLADIVNTP